MNAKGFYLLLHSITLRTLWLYPINVLILSFLNSRILDKCHLLIIEHVCVNYNTLMFVLSGRRVMYLLVKKH